MKKLLILGLIAVVLFSGCVKSETGPTGQVITNTETVQYNYIGHDGSCRTDTDCLIAFCTDSLDRHCVSGVQTETIMKCPNARLLSEKTYEKCACINNKCSLIQ